MKRLVRRDGDELLHLVTTTNLGGGRRSEIACVAIGRGNTVEDRPVDDAPLERVCELCLPDVKRLLRHIA